MAVRGFAATTAVFILVFVDVRADALLKEFGLFQTNILDLLFMKLLIIVIILGKFYIEIKI